MYYVGIDLGGTNIAAGLVDEDNNIVKKMSVPTLPERGNDAVTADIAKLISDLASSYGISLDEVAYAGLATPGAIDCDTGKIDRACNLLMEDYPIVDKLSALTPVKIYLENDANAAALGEAVAGAAKGAKYSVMITLGTGVGGGIVMDGKVYSGFNYAGGEIGHMVIEHNGRQCNCGRRGCFEAYSSATALAAMTREEIEKYPESGLAQVAKENGKVNGRTAFIAKNKGDEAGARVVEKYLDYLACGITNVINLFQPDIVCIGGGISNEGKGLIEPLLDKINNEVFTKTIAPERQTVIRLATLANDAGIVGAANLGK
ncbi:MAG: ROK family protein [Clostridia bacterium]|nr:ROK family protein [Clostridia bacterium]